MGSKKNGECNRRPLFALSLPFVPRSLTDESSTLRYSNLRPRSPGLPNSGLRGVRDGRNRDRPSPCNRDVPDSHVLRENQIHQIALHRGFRGDLVVQFQLYFRAFFEQRRAAGRRSLSCCLGLSHRSNTFRQSEHGKKRHDQLPSNRLSSEFHSCFSSFLVKTLYVARVNIL
jgi:hypothetical protein